VSQLIDKWRIGRIPDDLISPMILHHDDENVIGLLILRSERGDCCACSQDGGRDCR
jgi:hypothetical protein